MVIFFFTLLTNLYYWGSFLLDNIFTVISVAFDNITSHLGDWKFAFCCHLSLFLMQYLLYIFTLLNQHEDIQSNPGPVKDKFKNISCCHRNVNSLATGNYGKLQNLEGYNSFVYMKHILIHPFHWLIVMYNCLDII